MSGRALWTMLLILCPLVGYSFFQAVALYGEASSAARDAPVLASGLSPLDGVLVPTFGALYVAVTLAVSVRRHPQPRTRKGNRRAAPAGPIALPYADADRRQDGGDLRRLAYRAHSRGLGRGDLGRARRAPLCPGDRQSRCRPPALRLAGRRHRAVCGQHLRKLGDRGDHRPCLHDRLLGAGFRLGRAAGHARMGCALVADADAAHIRAGTAVDRPALGIVAAICGFAALAAVWLHPGVPPRKKVRAFARLRRRRRDGPRVGHAGQDIDGPHRGSAQLVSRRRSARAGRAARTAAHHGSPGGRRTRATSICAATSWPSSSASFHVSLFGSPRRGKAWWEAPATRLTARSTIPMRAARPRADRPARARSCRCSTRWREGRFRRRTRGEEYPGYPLVAEARPALLWFFGALPLLIVLAWRWLRRAPQIAQLHQRRRSIMNMIKRTIGDGRRLPRPRRIAVELPMRGKS